MTAIEQRARKMLAAEYRSSRRPTHADMIEAGEDPTTHDEFAVRALIAALTPPDGWVSPDDLLEAQDRAFYDGMSKCACPIPEGYVLVSAELLEDLAAEAESGIHQTVFVPAKRERRMAFVKEARALIAARLEAK